MEDQMNEVEDQVQIPIKILDLNSKAVALFARLKLLAPNGTCNQSYREIGMSLGICEPIVRKYIRLLEDRGYIKVVPKKGQAALIHVF